MDDGADPLLFAPWPAVDENLADCSWALGEALAWDGTGQVLYGFSRESGVILVMQRCQLLVRCLAAALKG